MLSVDEKPSIQALERAQGYLKLPNGRPMIGESRDHKRHGTTTLFATFDVARGAVVGRLQAPAADRVNHVAAQHQGTENPVILDNLSTHKPKRDMWPWRHPNVHLHYTPSSAATTIAPDPSSGQRASSIRSASSPVSRFSDSRYSQLSERAVLIVAT